MHLPAPCNKANIVLLGMPQGRAAYAWHYRLHFCRGNCRQNDCACPSAPRGTGRSSVHVVGSLGAGRKRPEGQRVVVAGREQDIQGPDSEVGPAGCGGVGRQGGSAAWVQGRASGAGRCQRCHLRMSEPCCTAARPHCPAGMACDGPAGWQPAYQKNLRTEGARRLSPMSASLAASQPQYSHTRSCAVASTQEAMGRYQQLPPGSHTWTVTASAARSAPHSLKRGGAAHLAGQEQQHGHFGDGQALPHPVEADGGGEAGVEGR